MSETPAITAKRFLSEADVHLRRGDIILSRSRTISSHVIRNIMGGTFSHAAIVFLTPKKDDGFNNTFVLESVSSGVRIANLADYVSGQGRSEIAILRFENPEATEAFFKSAVGLMLDHVNSGYDYGRIWRLALSFIFGLRVIGSRVTKNVQTSMRNAVLGTRKRGMKNWVPPQFICSGFIQYGLVKAARRADLDETAVMLRDDLAPDDHDGILALTPEDIATSTRMTWRFVVRRGFAHVVSDYDEAKRKLR